MALSAKSTIFVPHGEQYQHCNVNKPIPKVDHQPSFNSINKNFKKKSGTLFINKQQRYFNISKPDKYANRSSVWSTQ